MEMQDDEEPASTSSSTSLTSLISSAHPSSQNLAIPSTSSSSIHDCKNVYERYLCVNDSSYLSCALVCRSLLNYYQFCYTTTSHSNSPSPSPSSSSLSLKIRTTSLLNTSTILQTFPIHYSLLSRSITTPHQNPLVTTLTISTLSTLITNHILNVKQLKDDNDDVVYLTQQDYPSLLLTLILDNPQRQIQIAAIQALHSLITIVPDVIERRLKKVLCKLTHTCHGIVGQESGAVLQVLPFLGYIAECFVRSDDGDKHDNSSEADFDPKTPFSSPIALRDFSQVLLSTFVYPFIKSTYYYDSSPATSDVNQMLVKICVVKFGLKVYGMIGVNSNSNDNDTFVEAVGECLFSLLPTSNYSLSNRTTSSHTTSTPLSPYFENQNYNTILTLTTHLLPLLKNTIKHNTLLNRLLPPTLYLLLKSYNLPDVEIVKNILRCLVGRCKAESGEGKGGLMSECLKFPLVLVEINNNASFTRNSTSSYNVDNATSSSSSTSNEPPKLRSIGILYLIYTLATSLHITLTSKPLTAQETNSLLSSSIELTTKAFDMLTWKSSSFTCESDRSMLEKVKIVLSSLLRLTSHLTCPSSSSSSSSFMKHTTFCDDVLDWKLQSLPLSSSLRISVIEGLAVCYNKRVGDGLSEDYGDGVIRVLKAELIGITSTLFDTSSGSSRSNVDLNVLGNLYRVLNCFEVLALSSLTVTFKDINSGLIDGIDLSSDKDYIVLLNLLEGEVRRLVSLESKSGSKSKSGNSSSLSSGSCSSHSSVIISHMKDTLHRLKHAITPTSNDIFSTSSTEDDNDSLSFTPTQMMVRQPSRLDNISSDVSMTSSPTSSASRSRSTLVLSPNDVLSTPASNKNIIYKLSDNTHYDKVETKLKLLLVTLHEACCKEGLYNSGVGVLEAGDYWTGLLVGLREEFCGAVVEAEVERGMGSLNLNMNLNSRGVKEMGDGDVRTLTGPSDPLVLTLQWSLVEDDILIKVKVYNPTSININTPLRLTLEALVSTDSNSDSNSEFTPITSSLLDINSTPSSTTSSSSLQSSCLHSIMTRDPIPNGEFIEWAVCLKWNGGGDLTVRTFIDVCDIMEEVEEEEEKKMDKPDDDDDNDAEQPSIIHQHRFRDVEITCDDVIIPFHTSLKSCNLCSPSVHNGGNGDSVVFRYLFNSFNMRVKCHVKINKKGDFNTASNNNGNNTSMSLVTRSTVMLIPPELSLPLNSTGYSFKTTHGDARIFVILTQNNSNNSKGNSDTGTIEFRSNDLGVLKGVCGGSEVRRRFVEWVCGGRAVLDEDY